MIPSACAELGWRCVPLAVENYGAWGPEALKAFSQVASRLAIRGNTPKSRVVAELYGRLSLLLIRAIMLDQSWSAPTPQSTQQDSYPCMQCCRDQLFTIRTRSRLAVWIKTVKDGPYDFNTVTYTVGRQPSKFY